MFIERMKGQDYIDQSRAYLNYLEEHLNNVARAFQEVSEACDGMAWVGDDSIWHTLRIEVEHHDLSKFSSIEFISYRAKFFPVQEMPEEDTFDHAWEHHKLNNTHHWESIRYNPYTPGITERDLIHMVIDWTAMGYRFGDTAEAYYIANKNKIIIQPEWLPFLESIFEALRKHNVNTN